MGIVLDLSNTLYVADANNNRIQKLLFGNINATTVAGSSSGASGLTNNLLAYPNDVGVDSNGNVYVVDTNNNRIQLWYVNATSGITIAGNSNGKQQKKIRIKLKLSIIS
jgi:sugar lactone lactonase YvrE